MRPTTLIQRQGLLVRIECLLRGGDHLRRDVFLPHEGGLVALVAAADVRQRRNQPLDVALAVAHRDISEQVAQVAEFGLDVVKVAQHIIYFNAGQSHVQRVDRELGHVKVIDRVAVDQLAAVGIVVADAG